VLRTKVEVSQAIKSFFRMVKNQFDKNIKILRSDNGREFVNKAVQEFFCEQGVIHETSCVGTPQQNGIAERKNRHILETARTMLLGNNVPPTYWDYDITFAVYLINRMPSAVLDFSTPLQVLSNYSQLPSILNIPSKVFGCIAYVHIQKHQRTKLEPCAEECVFIGYDKHQKGYKCLNPISHKVFTTMDVTFVENKGYFLKEKILPQEENMKEEESLFVTCEPNLRDDINPILTCEAPDSVHENPPDNLPDSVHENSLDNLQIGSNPLNVTHETQATTPCTTGTESFTTEEDQMIQSPQSQYDQSPSFEVSVSNLENNVTNHVYQLPYRHNRGKAPRRYRPDEESEGRYTIGRFASTKHMSTQLQEFDKTLASVQIPTKFEEAMNDLKWTEAMNVEMEALEKNNTWQLVSLPKDRKTVGCKWVFTLKYGPTGTIDRYKARLVAKGFSQTYGVDYEETFSLVAKLNTIRVLLSITANLDWPLHQFDVKNAFLRGDINEEIYMDIPPEYGHSSVRPLVCKLNKALYELKQSPRAWFGRFCTLFFMKSNGKIVILIIYVDDMKITGDDQDGIRALEQKLSREFEMKNLEGLKYFLGIEVARTKEGISLSQRKYVLDLLAETGMLDCKPVDTPTKHNIKLGEFFNQTPVNKEVYQRLVGRLIYLSHTRSDIAYAVSIVSQFMHAPSEQHMEAVLWILRYLKGALGRGIFFRKNEHLRVEGYTDSDWAGDVIDRKSTSGYFTFVGGNLMTWRSKKQKVVALSSAEAEFRDIAKGLQELLWLRRVMGDLGFEPKEAMNLFCDNKSAITISQNPIQHDRTKHIEVDRHFIRQNLEEEVIRLPHVRTEEQLAYILTKGVSSTIFHQTLRKLDM
jgi:Reverse transcriptase (RNA-dependent DNA polymerase)